MGGIPSKPDYSKSMQVIGAGYSRTGTVSMQMALERLMDGPVQHGGTHFVSGSDGFNRKWLHCLQASRTGDKERALKYLREITAGYVGMTDLPGVAVLPELLELYPDVKVVLVIRDPEKWWKSMKILVDLGISWYHMAFTAIAPTWRWIPAISQEFFASMDPLLESVGRKPGDYGPWLVEAHNKMVMDLVPKDQLLVMELSQGWEPLCKFLGKPIPDEPFPRANDSAAIKQTEIKILTRLGLMWLALFTVLGGSIYGGLRLWKK